MSWLYQNVIKEDDERQPIFAQQSTVNWMRALRYEIDGEHGESAEDQFAACRVFLRNDPKTRNSLPLADVFEPLFRGVTNTMALIRLCLAEVAVPWIRATAIVTWYYATYACARAMFAAFGQPVHDQHMTAANAYVSVLRNRVPHPLNMVAAHLRNEDYGVQLPTYPNANPASLIENFRESRDVARGMLLQYLSGTATWYVDRTKEQILRENRFQDFRTKAARDERNRRLVKQIGFLHCAFRYRGKANYRDAIYLAYGQREPDSVDRFIEDMATVARFLVVFSLAFVERHVGKAEVEIFVSDLGDQLRRIDYAMDAELFWRRIYQ